MFCGLRGNFVFAYIKLKKGNVAGVWDVSRRSLHGGSTRVAAQCMVEFWRCFFFSFVFSLHPWQICNPCKKSEECYLLSLSHLVLIFLIVSNLNYFFFNLIIWHLIFISKFVLLFYDVSCLTLNVLISNLDSWLFYQILISFQFHPSIHDLIFNVFIFGQHFLAFHFSFGFLCEFDFSFHFCSSIRYLMIFKV
jgi:hypothetical protein